jgi:hypothetical protein
MYLREMGTVPLLTREGEVAIAKRIEQGKLAVIKSISRTPTIAKAIINMGDQLRAGERTVRELIIFTDEEITDDLIEERAQHLLRQIEAVKKARLDFQKLNEKTDETPKKDKRKYRRARWKSLRARIKVSQLIRKIEFTESVKRRLVEEVKDAVDAVQRVQREVESIERIVNPKVKAKAPKLKDEEKKILLKKQKDLKTSVKALTDELEETPERLRRTGQQHRAVGAAHGFDQPEDLEHRRAAADDAGKPLFRGGLPQHHVLVAQPARLEQLPHLHGDQIDVAERFFEERRGAEIARFLPFIGVAGPVRRHHQHNGVGGELAHRLHQLDAVEARHADVGEHHIHVLARHQVARGDAVVGGEHLEAVALEQQPHPFTHRLLVVGNQDARLGGRVPRGSRLANPGSRLPVPRCRFPHDACRSTWRSTATGNVTRNTVPPPLRGFTSIVPS